MNLSSKYKNKLRMYAGLKPIEEPINELDISDVELPKRYTKDSLNPNLWDGDALKPEIRKQLIKIANEFLKYLELGDKKPIDIKFVGSNANYNWNEQSDIDLHLFFNFNDINKDTKLVKKYFDAKKKLWNEIHNMKIKGFDIELYAQDKDETFTSEGIYSLKNNEWESKPNKEQPKIDKELLKKKIVDIADKIDDVIKNKSNDSAEISLKKAEKLKEKIKKMRRAGLDDGIGEFSVENLVFKYLRNHNYIKDLFDFINNAYDRTLSLDEENEKVVHIPELVISKKQLKEIYIRTFKEQKMKTINEEKESKIYQRIVAIAETNGIDISKYDKKELEMGYEVELEHGVINADTNVTNDDPVMTLKIALAHLNEVPDYYTKLKKYVEKEPLNESVSKKPKHKLTIMPSVDNFNEAKIELTKKFIKECCKELGITKPCKVYFTGKRGGPITTTASYNPGTHEIWIYTKNRNMIGDVFRSLAHEIRHFKQGLDGVLTNTSGNDGSPHENEANSFSGLMIRKFGKMYPEIFE